MSAPENSGEHHHAEGPRYSRGEETSHEHDKHHEEAAKYHDKEVAKHAEGPRYSRGEEAHHEHDKHGEEAAKYHDKEAAKRAHGAHKGGEEHRNVDGAVAHGGYSHGERKEEAPHVEEDHLEQAKQGGSVAHGGFYHGEHKTESSNATHVNGTIHFVQGNSTGNWSRLANGSTHGDQVIQYDGLRHQGGGSLSLQASVRDQHHNALATAGGAAVLAVVGFVAFKVVKKLRQRANYETIPTEATRMII
ncbi:hypothetical protein DYB36_000239 [Aphanomyces astaci]|uniref:Uncharacterized protein n=1 Tax=Aphanomyces astaci TaxID=112090 RepID=A0A397A4E4_APHAT|nr:hypothetical protein DYB36_000239 [Aphanomyces astaci]